MFIRKVKKHLASVSKCHLHIIYKKYVEISSELSNLFSREPKGDPIATLLV